MKKRKTFKPLSIAVLLMIVAVFSIQFLYTNFSGTKIIDAHESIESVENVIQLQDTMSKTGITKVVLSGIPEDILYFSGTVQSLADSKANNIMLDTVAEEFPEQFDYICTIDPNDFNKMELLETCITNGAVGVKLYNGYSYAHLVPVDDAKLSDLYARIAEAGKILILPVNTGEYLDELKNVLTLNPDLKVVCPHYCLSSKNLPRLTELMETYKNLYVDTSFGTLDLAIAGFQTITENKEAFEIFFDDFADRIIFATDNVVTAYEGKDSTFLTALYQAYIDLLTKEEFVLDTNNYKGLALSNGITKKVFFKNWQNLVE